MKKALSIIILSTQALLLNAQSIDYSVAFVPEESHLELRQITNESDYVCMPEVIKRGNSIRWFSNKIIALMPNDDKIGYLSYRNNTSNLFIKELSGKGGSIQRTNRQMIVDFSFSPDGKLICFSEKRGKTFQIFQTDASSGYVCRQITSGAQDFSPIYSNDLNIIFFARQDNKDVSIWGFDINDKYVSIYSNGMNPCPIPGTTVLLCSRNDSNGKSEIWKVDYSSGIEECLVSDPNRSFTTPSISPDGEWIVMVGESNVEYSNKSFRNTDIFVCKIDGSCLSQLTHHACDDLSPIWDNSGQFIYFVSQRGSSSAMANVWRMKFEL